MTSLRGRGRAFGAALINAWFVVLLVLFVLGPPSGSPEPRGAWFSVLVSQFYPYVLVFLALLAWWRATNGAETFHSIAAVRFLRAVENKLLAPRALYTLIAADAVLLFVVSARRHWVFESRGDTAITDHGLWNTVHGGFYRSSLVDDLNLFAAHFEPLQLAVTPLYLVAPSPLILFAAQAAMIALGAVPLYWITRRRLPGHPRLWAVFPVAYLAFAPLRAANRFDYHPGALVPTLFLFALYCLECRRWLGLGAFLMLAGLLKENLPAAGITFGLYVLVVERKRLLGAAMTVLFAAWFYAGFTWIIPAFNPHGYLFLTTYATLGDSMGEILTAPVLHPGRVLDGLLARTGWKLSYVLGLCGPLAFLPLLSPEALFLGSPFFGQHLLATTRGQVSLLTHNSAEAVPFVFFGGVLGAARLLAWLPRISWAQGWEPERASNVIAITLWSATFLFHGWSDLSYARQYATTPRVHALSAALELIPPDAAVAAPDRVLPHLTHRHRLYWFPPRITSFPPTLGGSTREAEVVVVDASEINPRQRAPHDAAVAQLTEQGYRPIFEQEGIVVWTRR